jgi:hypothetical protein
VLGEISGARGKSAVGAVVERALLGALCGRVHAGRNLDLGRGSQRCRVTHARFIIERVIELARALRCADRGLELETIEILEVTERVLGLRAGRVVAGRREMRDRFVEQIDRARAGFLCPDSRLLAGPAECHESERSLVFRLIRLATPARDAQPDRAAIATVLAVRQRDAQRPGRRQTNYRGVQAVPGHVVFDFTPRLSGFDGQAHVDVAFPRFDEVLPGLEIERDNGGNIAGEALFR